METGKVKWYSGNRGFGFIIPDNGGNDVYVHETALAAADLRDLVDKAPVKYNLKKHRGKMIAIDIELIEQED